MKDSYEFEVICKNLIIEYVNNHFDKTDDAKPINIKDVYVVWMCKTLQNSKALLSTTVPDGKYYEFTYNGDKNEMYMDVYTKLENICIPEIMFDKEVHYEKKVFRERRKKATVKEIKVEAVEEVKEEKPKKKKKAEK